MVVVHIAVHNIRRSAAHDIRAGSALLDIPAETFAQVGEGSHSIEADFLNAGEEWNPKQVYTVFPKGQVTIDHSEIDAAKAVRDVSYTARFRTSPPLSSEYYRFEIVSGQIPDGLTFHEGGYFTGAVKAAREAPYAFTVALYVRSNTTDYRHMDSASVSVLVEGNTVTNVEESSDPGYKLIQRVPTLQEDAPSFRLIGP